MQALQGAALISILQLTSNLPGCLQDHLQRATEVSRTLEGRLRAEGRGEMQAHIAALEAERGELRADLQAMAAHMADWRYGPAWGGCVFATRDWRGTNIIVDGLGRAGGSACRLHSPVRRACDLPRNSMLQLPLRLFPPA